MLDAPLFRAPQTECPATGVSENNHTQEAVATEDRIQMRHTFVTYIDRTEKLQHPQQQFRWLAYLGALRG